MKQLAHLWDLLITHSKMITIVLSVSAFAILTFAIYSNAASTLSWIPISLELLVIILNLIPEKPDIFATITQSRYYFQPEDDCQGVNQEYTRLSITVDIASRNRTTAVRNFRVRYNSQEYPARKLTNYGDVPLPPANIEAGNAEPVFFIVDLDGINLENQSEKKCELIFDSIHGTSMRIFFQPTVH